MSAVCAKVLDLCVFRTRYLVVVCDAINLDKQVWVSVISMHNVTSSTACSGFSVHHSEPFLFRKLVAQFLLSNLDVFGHNIDKWLSHYSVMYLIGNGVLIRDVNQFFRFKCPLGFKNSSTCIRWKPETCSFRFCNNLCSNVPDGGVPSTQALLACI